MAGTFLLGTDSHVLHAQLYTIPVKWFISEILYNILVVIG